MPKYLTKKSQMWVQVVPKILISVVIAIYSRIYI